MATRRGGRAKIKPIQERQVVGEKKREGEGIMKKRERGWDAVKEEKRSERKRGRSELPKGDARYGTDAVRVYCRYLG